MAEKKLIIGSIEVCDLPGLGIENLQIRVDTGAATSSLHVDNIKRYQKNGKPWIKFDIHPDVYNVDTVVECSSPICDVRRVKSSNGDSQERYVIETPITLGGVTWPIEITLTDRSDMSYMMLFGRQGMKNKVLVDPSKNYLVSSKVE